MIGDHYKLTMSYNARQTSKCLSDLTIRSIKIDMCKESFGSWDDCISLMHVHEDEMKSKLSFHPMNSIEK